MHREYTIEEPYAPRENIRPLHVSEQAECAFWFETNNLSELVYCEVSLTEDSQPTKTPIRLNSDLQSLLREPDKIFTFTLARINTKNGEPLLVYSKPAEGTAAVSRSNTKRTTIGTVLSEEANKLTQSKRKLHSQQSAPLLIREETMKNMQHQSIN